MGRRTKREKDWRFSSHSCWQFLPSPVKFGRTAAVLGVHQSPSSSPWAALTHEGLQAADRYAANGTRDVNGTETFLEVREFDDASWLCVDVNWLSTQVPGSYFYRGRQGQSALACLTVARCRGQAADTPDARSYNRLSVADGQNQETDSCCASSFCQCGPLRGCVSIICVFCASRAGIGIAWFGSGGRARYSNDTGEITLPFLPSLFMIY